MQILKWWQTSPKSDLLSHLKNFWCVVCTGRVLVMTQKPLQTALKIWKPVNWNDSSSLLFTSSLEQNHKSELKDKKARDPSSETRKVCFAEGFQSILLREYTPHSWLSWPCFFQKSHPPSQSIHALCVGSGRWIHLFLQGSTKLISQTKKNVKYCDKGQGFGKTL